MGRRGEGGGGGCRGGGGGGCRGGGGEEESPRKAAEEIPHWLCLFVREKEGRKEWRAREETVGYMGGEFGKSSSV